MFRKLILAAAVALGLASAADAVVLNLDSLPVGAITTTITIGDYTISPSSYSASVKPYIQSVNGHNVLIGTDTVYGDDAIIRRVDGGVFTLTSVVIGVTNGATGQNVNASNGYNTDLNNVASSTPQTISFGNNYANVTYVDLNGLKGAYYSQITLTSPSVPEPATWAMMVMGFGAIGYAMRRQQKVAPRTC